MNKTDLIKIYEELQIEKVPGGFSLVGHYGYSKNSKEPLPLALPLHEIHPAKEELTKLSSLPDDIQCEVVKIMLIGHMQFEAGMELFRKSKTGNKISELERKAAMKTTEFYYEKQKKFINNHPEHEEFLLEFLD